MTFAAPLPRPAYDGAVRALPRVDRPATLIAVAAVAVGALGAAFVAGLFVGASPARPSVVDQAAKVIREKADTPPSGQALDASAIQAMLSDLNDRWANYYASGPAGGDALQALLDGRYSGLGVWLRATSAQDARAVIASVTADSPAARAGLEPGDAIVEIDGRDTAAEDSGAIAGDLRGPSGTVVQLVVRSAGGATRAVAVTRADVPSTTVSTDLLAPGIERIRIATFSRGAGAQVAAAVAAGRAHGIDAYVLDLRGNPGGLLDEAVRTASVFLDGGPVVSLAGRSVPAQTLDAARGGDTRVPLAVLVDGGTASAAEVLAGALRDRGRAVLVGTRTFGKGSVQQVTHLSDGSELEITVATYRTPDGDAVDGVGIAPDVAVDPLDPPQAAADRVVTLLHGILAATDGA